MLTTPWGLLTINRVSIPGVIVHHVFTYSYPVDGGGGGFSFEVVKGSWFEADNFHIVLTFSNAWSCTTRPSSPSWLFIWYKISL